MELVIPAPTQAVFVSYACVLEAAAVITGTSLAAKPFKARFRPWYSAFRQHRIKVGTIVTGRAFVAHRWWASRSYSRLVSLTCLEMI